VERVDLTGGAPELNPGFRGLVRAARALGRRVQVRCNLTVLLVAGCEDLPEIYCDHEVELVCSLPCYTADNVDRQRGRGVFAGSIEALRRLNAIGYGRPGSPLVLDLVYNPVGAFLPPDQTTLEARYHDELAHLFGIEFRHLFTITNMPIRRLRTCSRATARRCLHGPAQNHFNPRTVAGLMCHSLLSSVEGTLYDCDFSQMLELPFAGARTPATIWSVRSCEERTGCRRDREPLLRLRRCGPSCGGVLA
jgi:radical SAM/Cys-rich protein